MIGVCVLEPWFVTIILVKFNFSYWEEFLGPFYDLENVVAMSLAV